MPFARFLIVDDCEPDIAWAEIVLAQHPHFHSVHSVQTGEEAWKLLAALGPRPADWPPHAVLLDLNMPGLNGIALMDRIAEELGGLDDILVFVLSSSDLDSERARFVEHPFVGGAFLKPLRPEDVERMVQVLSA